MTVMVVIINKQVQSDGMAYSSPIIECITLWSAIHYIIGGGGGVGGPTSAISLDSAVVVLMK